MTNLLIAKIKLFSFNKDAFSPSDAQKIASKAGSSFASSQTLSKKSISLLCMLFGLFAATTPLLGASKNIKNKIDHGLDNHYRSQGRYDYFSVRKSQRGKPRPLSSEKIGKFSEFCEDDGFDSDTIEEELLEKVEDCGFLNFDDTFPLPENAGDEGTYIFNLLKKCVSLPIKICGALRVTEEDLEARSKRFYERNSQKYHEHILCLRPSEVRKNYLIYRYLRRAVGVKNHRLFKVIIDLIKKYWWETQYCEECCILLTNRKDILSCQDKNKENRLYG
ncbi:MAG: hypothetical protein AAF335_04990, partial [Bacteroidota bacterium]